MPIKIQSDLPAKEQLEYENIFVMDERRAAMQEIRPLQVCILNLMIVLVGINLFKESKILKTILCVISLCTFVMIASSAYRMILYIRFYYLTFLRIFVLWALVVIALLMIGIIQNQNK